MNQFTQTQPDRVVYRSRKKRIEATIGEQTQRRAREASTSTTAAQIHNGTGYVESGYRDFQTRRDAGQADRQTEMADERRLMASGTGDASRRVDNASGFKLDA